MNKKWREKQVKLIERAQDRCVNQATSRTEAVLYEAIDSVVSALETGRAFPKLTLSKLFKVSADFYRNVIEEAFAHAEATKTEDKKPRRSRRLAKKNDPPGLPNTLRDLVQVFGDKRYWPRIMKRSKTQTEKLRQLYLKKLKRRFDKLLPQVTTGQLSPVEAKKVLQEEWQTTKARVSTIFRTETTNYFSKTQKAYYNGDPEIIGFMFDSVKDQARTKICRDRHGLIYRPNSKLLEENTPALHFNCRSHLIPLANTAENRRLLEDPSRDPAKRKVAPLPTGWRN